MNDHLSSGAGICFWSRESLWGGHLHCGQGIPLDGHMLWQGILILFSVNLTSLGTLQTRLRGGYVVLGHEGVERSQGLLALFFDVQWLVILIALHAFVLLFLAKNGKDSREMRLCSSRALLAVVVISELYTNRLLRSSKIWPPGQHCVIVTRIQASSPLPFSLCAIVTRMNVNSLACV